MVVVMMIDDDIECDYSLERNGASLKLVVEKLCDGASLKLVVEKLPSSSPMSISASFSSGAGALPDSWTRPGSPEKCAVAVSRFVHQRSIVNGGT